MIQQKNLAWKKVDFLRVRWDLIVKKRNVANLEDRNKIKRFKGNFGLKIICLIFGIFLSNTFLVFCITFLADIENLYQDVL